MASVNTPVRNKVKATTHEGAQAANLTNSQELRLSVLACRLWEDNFYESGVSIAERITNLATGRPPFEVAALAVEARNEMHLRHVPLLLLNVLTKTGAGIPHLVANTFASTIQRPDELAEFLAIYWKEGKRPLSAQAKKGLAKAFANFDQYQLSKYKGTKDAVSLRDVMFLAHPKPEADRVDLYKAIADKTIEAPDTWEVALSAGADKKETFTRLLNENSLGYLALLRNLRGMAEAGVDSTLINKAIEARKGAQRVLPFRYLAAVREAPQFAASLDKAMTAGLDYLPAFEGKTAVLVDLSGSMDSGLSAKSKMTCADAACALAVFVRGTKRVYGFGTTVQEVAAYNGLSGIESIRKANVGHGTNIGIAVAKAIKDTPDLDRVIVVTDMQSHDNIARLPKGCKGYMLNVASYKNAVGHTGDWTHITGFSENVIAYIQAYEAETSK